MPSARASFLLAYLTAQVQVTPANMAKWPDYWRGFWDGTRHQRAADKRGARMAHSTDAREYINGLNTAHREYPIPNARPGKAP